MAELLCLMVAFVVLKVLFEIKNSMAIITVTAFVFMVALLFRIWTLPPLL